MSYFSLTRLLPTLLATLATSSALAGPHSAQQEKRLCINEGATTVSATFALEYRYQPLADVIQKATGQKVNVSAFTKVPLFLQPFNAGECDYVYGKTIDALADGIKDGQTPGKGYHALVKNSQAYVAGIIVSKDFTGKDLASLVGMDVMMPPKDTFTAQLMLAELRNAGLRIEERDTLDKFPTDVKDAVTLRYVSYQEAVSFTVDTGRYKVGAVNPTVLAAWKGRILKKFNEQPGWVVLAAASTSDKDRAAVTAALEGLKNAPDGKALLKSLKLDGFVPATDGEYLAALDYVRNSGRTVAEAAHKTLVAKSSGSKPLSN